MDKIDIEELRAKVGCAALLESEGWQLDKKESTRSAVKYRLGARIIIVNHEGRGWFDPLSTAKGDVFSLAILLRKETFVGARDHIASLVGFVPTPTLFQRSARNRPVKSVSERWSFRAPPFPGSASWSYLTTRRRIAEEVVAVAARLDELREGPAGSMWAAHRDMEGKLLGWEERGPSWHGFSTGGAKQFFWLGRRDAERVCITEAAIDALSLGALEHLQGDTAYVSTGGGWSPATESAILFLAQAGRTLVAATDNNRQGDIYAKRISAIASSNACPTERLRPVAGDWNEDLFAHSALRRRGSQSSSISNAI